MSNVNQHVPPRLLTLQHWFGNIVKQPYKEQIKADETLHEEAQDLLSNTPLLSQIERLEIYHHQYWWRLFSALQEVFPLLCSLFGYRSFNEKIALPFLEKHPPNDWSLGRVGKELPSFLEATYTNPKDRLLILESAKLDWAFWDLFFVPCYPPLAFEGTDIEKLLSIPLKLQPSLKLLKLPFDLLSLRKQLLKQETDYWLTYDFPQLDQSNAPYYFLLYRSKEKGIIWQLLEEGQWILLTHLQQGKTLEEICSFIEEREGELLSRFQEMLPIWIRTITYQELIINI